MTSASRWWRIKTFLCVSCHWLIFLKKRGLTIACIREWRLRSTRILKWFRRHYRRYTLHWCATSLGSGRRYMPACMKRSTRHLPPWRKSFWMLSRPGASITWNIKIRAFRLLSGWNWSSKCIIRLFSICWNGCWGSNVVVFSRWPVRRSRIRSMNFCSLSISLLCMVTVWARRQRPSASILKSDFSSVRSEKSCQMYRYGLIRRIAKFW